MRSSYISRCLRAKNAPLIKFVEHFWETNYNAMKFVSLVLSAPVSMSHYQYMLRLPLLRHISCRRSTTVSSKIVVTLFLNPAPETTLKGPYTVVRLRALTNSLKKLIFRLLRAYFVQRICCNRPHRSNFLESRAFSTSSSYSCC